MAAFETKILPGDPDDVAPDGSDVRVLLRLQGGSMAHFQLGPGETSTAVALKGIEEIWFFLSGEGEMWRMQENEPGRTVKIRPGICLTIPDGTHFQFRTTSDSPLAAIGVTMPPWPGVESNVVVAGHWKPTVPK
jgi:mannose-6-phosphate isomerase-like protein (cupin superfamily)